MWPQKRKQAASAFTLYQVTINAKATAENLALSRIKAFYKRLIGNEKAFKTSTRSWVKDYFGI